MCLLMIITTRNVIYIELFSNKLVETSLNTESIFMNLQATTQECPQIQSTKVSIVSMQRIVKVRNFDFIRQPSVTCYKIFVIFSVTLK